MATLIITQGPATGQQLALGEHRIVMIGRDQDCTFQVLDQQISRRHMQLKAVGGGHTLVDFNSANGVLLNGRRVEQETPLCAGDEIRIGETTLLYTSADSPDAATIDELLRKRGENRRSTLLQDDEEG